MKIAINCAFYQPRGGGIKEYIHNLIANLSIEDKANEYVIYFLEENIDYARKHLPTSFKIKPIPFRGASKFEVIRRSLLEGKFWRKEEKEEKFDLFHSPFFHAPRLKATPVILTVHDLRFFRFPSTYAFLRYIFLKYKVKNSVKRAAHIISISNFTKKEVIDAYGIDDSKITVIHEAINPERFKPKADVKGLEIEKIIGQSDFLLAVGHLEPRKNYERLIQAFKRFIKNDSFSDFKLIIVGRKDHSYSKTIDLINKSPEIIYLDFVDHDTLLWLYGHARLHILPSIYEGFGFTPLEAASQGTVSAVSNLSSIPEICGDAVFYFNPYDITNMESTIKEALSNSNEFNEKQANLPKRLENFSWRKNALGTILCYEQTKNKLKIQS